MSEDVGLRGREWGVAVCLLVSGFGELGMDVLIVKLERFVFGGGLRWEVVDGCLSFGDLSVFYDAVVFSGVSCVVESFEDGVYGFLECV